MQFVDLFCGAGGLSAGFASAGFEPIAAFDSWGPALDVYSYNLGGHAHLADIAQVSTMIKRIARLKPQLIAGGPPCQEFSQAGCRQEGDRAELSVAYARIVAAVRPEWFVVENVARAIRSRAFAKAVGILRRAGYGISVHVLDASLCGVPQKRKRLFCIGRLGAQDDFLTETISASLSVAPLTVRQYCGDELDVDYYYHHPRSYARRAVHSIDESAPTIRGGNRPVAPRYPGHVGDATSHLKVRALTADERSRIQTFPVGWRWTAGKTATDQMIGNAVPVELAAFVARAISAYVYSSSTVLQAA